MKNKIVAICISLLVSIAFIVPPGIFAEENAADGTSQAEALNNEQIEDSSNSEQTSDDVTNNEEIASETENENSANANAQDEQGDEEAAEAQMAKSPQNAPEDETPWAKLKKKIEEGSSHTIAVNEDVIADLDKDAGRTINIKSGKNIVLKGNSEIKGIGFSSFTIENGGSLTINGPSISNAQIITKGDLTLNSGKISDTKLEGPTIFVNAGTFTMNGGEVSGNEAVFSTNPQPSGLKLENRRYLYSPITVYNGNFKLNYGKISENNGFFKGGAIGIWGQDSAKSIFKIYNGEITNNIAIYDNWNSLGGAIFMENCDFEMKAGTVSQNTTEYGGGIAAIRSKMTFTGGSITENTNGEYKGLGGGIYAEDSNIDIENINVSGNIANGHGGGIYASSSQSEKHTFNIYKGSFKNNATKNDVREIKCRGGAIFACNYTFNIYGGEFLNNSAFMSGGAIGLEGEGKCTINSGIFKNNESNGFWGGGAIYNDHGSKLVINRALIKNNTITENIPVGAGNRPVSRQGGGIWNCPTGNTLIHITNGLALYENSAPNFTYSSAAKGAGDDFANITKYLYGEQNGTSSVRLASRMLGGGYRLWYQDGSFYSYHSNWPEAQQTPRYNPEKPVGPLAYDEDISEQRGKQLVFKSVPTGESKALAEQIATSVFTDNRALGVGISGGAITNNGELEFGEDTPYKIIIKKSWTGDDINTRPKSITLKMYVGEHYIEDIVLTKEEKWTKTIKDFPDPDTLIDKTTGKVLPINFKEENSGKYVLSVTKTIKDKDKSTYTIDLENKIPKPPEPPEKITVEGSKTWDDAKNQDGKRPEEITINLLKNGEKIASKKVTEADGWKWKFENLEKYENGKLIEYTISEEKVEGYKTEIAGNAKDGFVITNTYVPPEKPPTPPTPPKTPPEKPKSQDTSDRNNMNIMCIALMAASIAAIYTLRKKKNI